MTTKAAKPDVNIGDLCVMLRYCDHEAVRRARAEQTARAAKGQATPIGAILVEHDSITRGQLEDALAKQREVRRSPSRAASVLMRLIEERVGAQLAAAGSAR